MNGTIHGGTPCEPWTDEYFKQQRERKNQLPQALVPMDTLQCKSNFTC